MPTIVSIAEDAITAVPRQYREAAIAMGATKWQTTWRNRRVCRRLECRRCHARIVE